MPPPLGPTTPDRLPHSTEEGHVFQREDGPVTDADIIEADDLGGGAGVSVGVAVPGVDMAMLGVGVGVAGRRVEMVVLGVSVPGMVV